MYDFIEVFRKNNTKIIKIETKIRKDFLLKNKVMKKSLMFNP